MHRHERLEIRPLGVPSPCEQILWRLRHALCDERPPIGARQQASAVPRRPGRRPAQSTSGGASAPLSAAVAAATWPRRLLTRRRLRPQTMIWRAVGRGLGAPPPPLRELIGLDQQNRVHTRERGALLRRPPRRGAAEHDTSRDIPGMGGVRWAGTSRSWHGPPPSTSSANYTSPYPRILGQCSDHSV